MNFLALKRNINMELFIQPECRKYFECFFGDEKRWEQIFLNFISNSLKFSKNNGSVKVEISVQKTTPALANELNKLSNNDKSNADGFSRCDVKNLSLLCKNDLGKKTVQFSQDGD